MNKLILFVIGILIGLAIWSMARDEGVEDTNLKNGDLIFQKSRTSQSDMLEAVTGSAYTHMGIIFMDGERTMVYEAVGPVQAIEFEGWIRKGVDKHYVVKRIKKANKLLTADKLAIMKQTGRKFFGKNYDEKFQWSDDLIYCSELVWKIYDAVGIEIGPQKKFSDFDLKDPAVVAAIQARYLNNTFDKNEIVVTPIDMFNASNLVEVRREGKLP